VSKSRAATPASDPTEATSASDTSETTPASEPTRDADGPCLVIGYDRTDSAREAATWAANELAPDGKLVIVHACRPLHAPPSPLSTPQERHHLGQALIDELLLEGEDALYDVHIATEVSDDDPVTALIGAAQRHGARAIVVGCEQHSRLHKAIGTVTGELLKTSPVPVTIVPFASASTTEPTAG
jgi:nucleotide-binding universal stress UspA family protein